MSEKSRTFALDLRQQLKRIYDMKRKNEDECIALASNKSIDEIVNDYHVLQESIRQLLSRHCSEEGANDADTAIPFRRVQEWTVCDIPTEDAIYFAEVYETEGEGIIMVCTENYEGDPTGCIDLDSLSTDNAFAIACAIEEVGCNYGD